MYIRKRIIDTAIIFLCLLVGTLMWGNPLPCRAGDTGPKGRTFSLDMNKSPLDHALKQLSKVTGYEISVNEPWGNRLLTATLNNVTISKGLRRIIQTLGKLSYLIITYEESKRIEILIIPSYLAKGKSVTVTPRQRRIHRTPVRVRSPYRPRRQNKGKSTQMRVDQALRSLSELDG
jgi:hypothetical protein